MLNSSVIVRNTILIVAAACLAQSAPAFSQSTANPPIGDSAKESPTSTQPEASSAAPGQSRASKKAARKANHEKKNAELKKLEKNGYNPATEDNTYPESLQNAEKKANGK